MERMSARNLQVWLTDARKEQEEEIFVQRNKMRSTVMGGGCTL